jgi:hypothetical protein
MAPTHTEPSLERAIVLQLLRDDHGLTWSHEELGEALAADPDALERAVRRLGADGVLCHCGERVSAGRAARRLDDLGLIAV